MIDRRLDYELYRGIREGRRLPALCFVKNNADLRYLEEKYNVVSRFPFIRAVGVELDYKGAIELSSSPYVEYLTCQPKVTTLDDESKESIIDNTYLYDSVVEALGIETKLTGRGVTLCIMDTGVNTHSDLSIPRQRIKEFYDVENHLDYPYDDNGHGTFVAGVAASNGILSGGKRRGVAPACDIVGIKVISKSGESGAFKVLEGMQWVLDNAKRLNIRVICMSFGADPLEINDPLKLGAETLVRNGITVVCAAGNSGAGGLKSPGISPYVITVGAVDNMFEVAPFSSSGIYDGVKKPDIYARGVGVTGIKRNGTYTVMSGTSVSAPYVAGAACLALERCPTLTPAEIKRILLTSCDYKNGRPVLDFNL